MVLLSKMRETATPDFAGGRVPGRYGAVPGQIARWDALRLEW